MTQQQPLSGPGGSSGDGSAADGAFIAKFIEAQNRIYPEALAELRAGQKKSHWMWFVFPQIAGLGQSETARHYAIESLAQAQVYLGHPVLVARLHACTEAVLLHARDAAAPRILRQIFGTPDDLKFHSSMTLFHRADREDPVFKAALSAFFGGQEDGATLGLL